MRSQRNQSVGILLQKWENSEAKKKLVETYLSLKYVLNDLLLLLLWMTRHSLSFYITAVVKQS